MGKITVEVKRNTFGTMTHPKEKCVVKMANVRDVI